MKVTASQSRSGNPGFEAFEESKHATLWVMVANRYFLQIELQNRDQGIAGMDQTRRSEEARDD